ncbi:hypothetical protein D1007_23050 [Hordeum vulgare]|nr:hypothetical protein D1007_23050 [Hordeum vulgare]
MHGVIRGDDILVGDVDVTNQFLNESGEGDESLNTQGRSSGEVDAHASGKGGIGGSNEEEADCCVEVINAYSSFLLGEVKEECYIIPTWRVKWLLEYRQDKQGDGTEYEGVSNSNEPVNRCLNEYFKAPKAYMALKKDNTHWVMVVMHKEKEDFHVLDSLIGKELDSTTRKLVEDLRRETGADIAEANATGGVQYPDISIWPIKT